MSTIERSSVIQRGLEHLSWSWKGRRRGGKGNRFFHPIGRVPSVVVRHAFDRGQGWQGKMVPLLVVGASVVPAWMLRVPVLSVRMVAVHSAVVCRRGLCARGMTVGVG